MSSTRTMFTFCATEGTSSVVGNISLIRESCHGYQYRNIPDKAIQVLRANTSSRPLSVSQGACSVKHSAFVDHQRRQISGGDDVHLSRLGAELGGHPGHDPLDLARRPRTPSPTAAPRRCSWRSPSAAAAAPPCAAGRRGGRAPPARSRCPGAIAPPTYWPLSLTTSNVVAVPPKSTTIAGPPYSVAAARALMIRSVPTSRGLSISTGTPVRTPGSTTTLRHVAEVADQHVAPLVQHRRHRRADRDPVDLVDRAAEQPADQHRPLVGGAALVGGDPPVGGDLAVGDQPEHGVGVADVGGEQGHLVSPRAGPCRCRRPSPSG